jgi:D-alanine-D-alanine ligase
MPRVAVLHNALTAASRGGEADRLAVEAVEGAARAGAKALEEAGWSVSVQVVPGEARELAAMLSALEADLVFNMVEELAGDARGDAAFAAMLELWGIPYTGAGPRALTLCLEKPVARAVLAARGVRVPRGAVLENGTESLGGLRFPVIVKPSREDASHGIELASVVAAEREARERARLVIERYGQPALVEEYVDGREVNAALVARGGEVEVLPLGEIDFSGFPAGAPRIVTYAGKWVEDSADWRATLSVAARLEPAEEARVRETALAAWTALGLADYARVDLRLDASGEPFVIDVNPNPDLSPGAGFALAAERRGWSHAQLILHIAEAALERAPAAARRR